jgi:hypothetical protein
MFVKPVDQITSKWSQRAGQAGQAYTAGVAAPRRPWQASTVAAAPNWASGVQAAVTNGRFASGVSKAGDSKWQAGASGKGAQRYPQGVGTQQAQQNFTSGFSPYASVLQSLTLAPRMPKGDPANNLRAAAVALALHNKKLGK